MRKFHPTAHGRVSLAAALALVTCLPAGGQERCELQKFRPDDSLEFQFFGGSLAMDGGRMAVGAPQDNDLGLHAGSVYVYEKVGRFWQQGIKLLPNSTGTTDRNLGEDVALEGSTIVAGAAADCPSCLGAVYIFEETPLGWTETRLQPTTVTFGDVFGEATAVDGETVAAGARRLYVGGGVRPGGVYVWRKSGGSWPLEQLLVASDGGNEYHFGEDVALVGDRLIVGADRAFGGGINTGAAYVFERSGSVWTEVQKLFNPAGASFDGFGGALAAEGDRLAVGAGGEGATGRVYLYEHDGSAYVLADTIDGAPVATTTRIGSELALHGDRLVVSSIGTQQIVATYRWEASGAVFEESLVQGDALGGDAGFGDAVGVGATTVVVGDLADGDGGSLAGAVYVYEDGVPAPGTIACNCDAASAPCGNASPTTGCVNVTGHGAWIRACHTTSVTLDDLVITVHDKPLAFGTIVMGDAASPVPFDNGLLCTGPVLFRFPVQVGFMKIGPGIVAHAHANFGVAGDIVAGSTWTFQGWYRDAGGPCGLPSNLTNAIEIAFGP